MTIVRKFERKTTQETVDLRSLKLDDLVMIDSGISGKVIFAGVLQGVYSAIIQIEGDNSEARILRVTHYHEVVVERHVKTQINEIPNGVFFELDDGQILLMANKERDHIQEFKTEIINHDIVEVVGHEIRPLDSFQIKGLIKHKEEMVFPLETRLVWQH